MRRILFAAFGAALAVSAGARADDVVVETAKFKLVIGGDAAAKSLVLKANGEECLDARERTPLFAAVQARPFNNEIKLANPNRRTSYPANRVRWEGDDLVVGFETAPYEARLGVRTGEGYVAFTLRDFICARDVAYSGLALDVPPVARFRVLQLPLKTRTNVGEWLNVTWDARAAAAVVACDPYADADGECRRDFRLAHVDLHSGKRLRGGAGAVVAGAGSDDFLASMDAFERDFGLPRGVRSRRDPRLNASIAWTAWATPANFDEILSWAKRGGFRMMLLYYASFTKGALENGYWVLHDYDWRDDWPGGWQDLDGILARTRAAGMTPGLHVLQTHVGLGSSYVTPRADPRLNLKRRFTLMSAIPADGEVGELRVAENPVDSPTFAYAKPRNGLPGGTTRVLKFGTELFTYEGYVTEPPYRFVGVRRGAFKTDRVAHPHGELGGVLDVSEFAAVSCYADQDTDLPDEIARKIAALYDRGFEFLYFDGSEGVNEPCNVNVSLGQWRVTEKLGRPPLFTEGAAKSHFGWHLQAGANAYDVFPPEIFKKMIVRHPLADAPRMRKDFTRLDFGWWNVALPGSEVTLADRLPNETVKTIGTQPDMWEFGTSRAAAWDCPATVMVNPSVLSKCRRAKDLFEVMRRWEDVRATGWLTPAQKEALKSPTQEHHLYRRADGRYELHPIEMLTPDRPGLRAFLFEREGRRVVAYWHTADSGRFVLADGKGTVLEADDLKYFETDLSADAVRTAFAGAVPAASPFDELVPRPQRVTPSEGRVAWAGLPVREARGRVDGSSDAVADQAYSLTIRPTGVDVVAGGEAGARHARATLEQLARLGGGRIPCGRIDDWPALKWRGFMLDVGRNFQPVETIRDLIDFMAAYKLNLFHWHLTDYWGWRLESRAVPELASDRATLRDVGRRYTQAEFLGIVDYAAARGVTVLPEFDVPGHTHAFRQALGVESMRDPKADRAIRAFLDEFVALVPPEKVPFIHLGTDEVRNEPEKVDADVVRAWARHAAARGHVVVGWAPGMDLSGEGVRCAKMLWGSDDDSEGLPFFDMTGRYIDAIDPFEILGRAAYLKPCRWDVPESRKLGAVIGGWHDDTLAGEPSRLFTNIPVFPAIVLNGDAFWSGRDANRPEFRERLPPAGHPALADAVDLERRLVAQRDRALPAGFRYPFAFLAQTQMRWRLSYADGTLIAADIPQATVQPRQARGATAVNSFCPETNATVVAETWIRSPTDQTVGAWIGFTDFQRSSGRAIDSPTPRRGEWNRHGAQVELNGERLPPPAWTNPGLAPTAEELLRKHFWTFARCSNEIPFTDEEYYMRAPYPIRLKRGWNHVRLVLPAPPKPPYAMIGRWVGTFVPLLGTSARPREVLGLTYRSSPPASGAEM